MVGRIGQGAKSGRQRWTQTDLHDFCALAHCTDGSSPRTGVTADGTATLFGVTYSGGNRDLGMLFKLVPGVGDSWSASKLYDFCGTAHRADGDMPGASLLIDASGNLFGETPEGGTGRNTTGGGGVVYELSPRGRSRPD